MGRRNRASVACLHFLRCLQETNEPFRLKEVASGPSSNDLLKPSFACCLQQIQLSAVCTLRYSRNYCFHILLLLEMGRRNRESVACLHFLRCLQETKEPFRLKEVASGPSFNDLLNPSFACCLQQNPTLCCMYHTLLTQVHVLIFCCRRCFF